MTVSIPNSDTNMSLRYSNADADLFDSHVLLQDFTYIRIWDSFVVVLQEPLSSFISPCSWLSLNIGIGIVNTWK